jgi:hypothetical protein
MLIRYLYYVALALASAFLVLATAAFSFSTVADLTLGLGIAMLVVSLAIAALYQRPIATFVVSLCVAAVSVWMIIASQAFSAATVDDITFVSALVVGALTLIGLTAHELSAERAVHAIERAKDRDRMSGPRAAAA